MPTVSDTPNLAPPRRSVQADTLAASVVILLIATVVQRTVGFGRSVLFCRWLTPEVLGEWEMVYSFLMLAAPLAVLGVPGSFGRYAEHYRQRGQLRTFLHRAAIWTGVCTIAALGLIEFFAPEFSTLIFGRDDLDGLVRGIGLCLASVIVHHTLTALLAALRLYRIVSAMNFVQSLLFAGVSLGLMWFEPNIPNIVWGYSIASIGGSAFALAWAWPALVHLEPASSRLPHGMFWAKLLRFAFFVWVSNLFSQLFAVVDRYMLVHCAGLSPAEALDQVGHYHSSRVIPLLLVSIAELLSGMIMPHLSHDWEIGRRDHVGQRLNTGVKLTSLGMLLGGAAILAAAPFLFHVVLEGRYDEGLAVLPWTLAGCAWYSIYCIAQNYLWCAEKTRLATAPLGLALMANIVLNLFLLPQYGLHGAVLATALSTALGLGTVLALSNRHGMPLDAGTWLLAASPTAIGFGTWPAIAMCGALAILAISTTIVFTVDERRELTACVRDSVQTFVPFLNRRRAARSMNAPQFPLRVLFLTTSMPVGGAETLLMNLVRGLDRRRFAPEIVCLKDLGPLGEKLACEMRVHSHMLTGKWDLRVLPRLWRIMRIPRADAVITVGAGDKMFWGRLAAKLAGVPVIGSALHSTGWPDGVGRLNRMLTPLTDAFIAVADAHGRHLVDVEGFPERKVHVIYNGIDASRFAPRDATATRVSLGIPLDAPVIGILAALRPEKNHELFLAGAQRILEQLPMARFVVVGDGPKRPELEALAAQLDITQAVHFLGTRSDVPELLAACNLVALTSHNEAAPVSILEALSAGVPVVASNVGSVSETVIESKTGRLFAAGDLDGYVATALDMLRSPADLQRMGAAGRQLVVERWSLDAMVRGYEQLIDGVYYAKTRKPKTNPVWEEAPASLPSPMVTQRSAEGSG